MSFFEFFIFSLALSIELLIVLRSCALKTRIVLTRGLCVSVIAALIYSLLLVLGIVVGNVLRFESATDPGLYDNINSLIYLGLMIVVGLKMMLPAMKKNRQIPAYDISRWATVFALSVASGINVLLVGLGLGFIASVEHNALKGAITLFVMAFLFGYLGIMMGRQKKMLGERRWMLIAVLLLLVTAIFRVVEY